MSTQEKAATDAYPKGCGKTFLVDMRGPGNPTGRFTCWTCHLCPECRRAHQKDQK